MTFKLFKVTLLGGINPVSTNYKTSFVVAESPNDAYQAIRDFLDSNNLCFQCERELESIELLAEDCKYPACRTMLFLSDLTKIAGERDDQAARIKELESSLDEAEALTKKNAELMNGYLGRIKVLEKNCIYDPGDGKIFVPDGHPEIERLRARVVALEDALAEYQRLRKIISEFAVIPCLTVHGNCDQCRPKTKAACEAIAAIHKGKIGSGGGA